MGIAASIRQKSPTSPVDVGSYKFGPIIGIGGFSTVRSATYMNSGKVFVMKELKLDDEGRVAENQLDKFILELSALRIVRGQHPNVINVHAGFRANSSCFMVLDYLQGGDIRYHLSCGITFGTNQVAYLIGSIAAALHFLHSNRILHRDVKPENIVLTLTGVPVLVDFGECHVESTSSLAPLCSRSSGSSPYIAPEVLTTSHRHSVQADFWSLGITMFELLFRSRPFRSGCSHNMVYFSENHYHVLWERLQNASCLECDGDEFDACGDVDWLKLASCNEAMRQSVMPLPDRDIPLSEDKTLPVELKVRVPTVTAGNLPVSDACKDLLWGLLDVRIPLRLGSGSNYSAFVDHYWFIENNCTFEGATVRHNFPFVPSFDKVNSSIRERYAEVNYMRSHSLTETKARIALTGDFVLSHNVQHKLQAFEFVAPSVCPEWSQWSQTEAAKAGGVRTSATGSNRALSVR
jgi:serine/threonine protein kinase